MEGYSGEKRVGRFYQTLIEYASITIKIKIMKKYTIPVQLLLIPFLFPLKKTGKNRLTDILLVVTVVCTGCFQHYFRTNTQTSVDDATLKLLQNSDKYFVVHFDANRVFGLNDVSVNGDKLEGSLVVLPDEHNKYINPEIDKANSVYKKDKGTALLEVHLYTNNTLGNTSRLSLSISLIDRIDVYTFDKKRTKASSIMSGIGIAAMAASLAVIFSAGAATSGF